jgi:hypothetical protein
MSICGTILVCCTLPTVHTGTLIVIFGIGIACTCASFLAGIVTSFDGQRTTFHSVTH